MQQRNDFFAHLRGVGAQHGGAPGLQEIKVDIAVNIRQLVSARLGDDQREGIVERQVVLHSPGNALLGLLNHRLGLGAFFLEVVIFIVPQR